MPPIEFAFSVNRTDLSSGESFHGQYKSLEGLSCTDCHGTEPQAKWEAYNSWDGFFGSVSREGEDVMQKDPLNTSCIRSSKTGFSQIPMPTIDTRIFAGA